MTPQRRGFDDKLLAKIGKIDRRHLHDYIARLLSQKNFFETVFNHLSDGIIVADSRLRIIYSNPVARRMLLWPRRKFYLGEDLAERSPEGELRELWVAMRRQPRPIDKYDCTVGKDGKRRITLTAISVEPEEGDEPAADDPEETMWVFLMHDVTERYKSIEEHARAQRLASLALLTSGIAHEIKNPLNSLNIHAQILLDEARQAGEAGGGIAPDKVRRAASVMLEETARLTEVVNQFIQASHPDKTVLEPHSLNRVIEDLIRVFKPECEKAGIELRTELEPGLPPVHLDPHLMFQALRNLVRNAIEARATAAPSESDSAAEPEPAFITLRTLQTGDSVAVEVADNGPGIPEEDIPRIFDAYFTTKFNGTGLGLLVVSRIVAQHGGSVHVDSRPGLGSRFIIRLPLTERPVRLLDEPAPTQPAGASN